MRILLVCTNPRVADEVTSALVGESEVDIVAVRTPERALQQLDDAGGYDLVVGDADTAPTGGFALAREVKARADMGRDVPPVVLLIARDDDRFLAKWSRADAYVRKPADPFDLAEVVKAVAVGRPLPALPHVGGVSGELPGDLAGVESVTAQGGGSMLGSGL